MQFIAAILSVRLIQVTGRKKAWILIAIAMTLMGIRRSITLYHSISSGITYSTDLTAELVALAISILMVSGVLLIGPIFRKIQSTNKALQRSEEKLKSAIELSPDCITLTRLSDGKIVEVNKGFCHISGYLPDEIMGKNASDLWEVPEEREQFMAKMKKDGHITGLIHKFRSKDGTILTGSLSAVILQIDGEKYSFSIIQDITERRQVEEALQVSEERFRILYDNNPLMLFTIDEDGKVLSVNQYGIDQLGYSKELLIGKPVINVFYEEDRPTAQEYLKQCFAVPHDVHKWELRKIRRDGTVIYVRETVRVVDDVEGKPMAMVVCEDITDYKEAEKSLLESEARLKEAQHVAEIGSWELDLISNTLYWSDEVYRIFDLEPQEFEATYEAFLEHVHPDDRAFVNKAYTDSVKNKVPYNITHRLLVKDGTIKFVNERCHTYYDDAGKVLRSVGTVQDITERKLTEETLRESNERFTASFEDAAIGMVLVSLDHRIMEANQVFCSMLGYTKNELLGVLFKDITHPDDVDKSLDQHNKLIAGEIDNYHFEKRYIHKQGHEIWGMLSTSLVRDKYTTPLYVIAQIQDITERKWADEQLSYQASHDALTGLVNRHEFERRIERLLSTVKQDKRGHALCFMDLDQFKVVNDTCGHIAGDELLRHLGQILQGAVRHRDTLSRLGGDEFGVLMEHCSLDDAHRVATSLLKAIQDHQFVWEGRVFKVGVSMGLVPITSVTANLTELLKQADVACYMAKDKGRNRIHVYHAEDAELAQRHGEMQWVTRLNHALEEDRFCLYAQSIMPLDGSTDIHYELLLRMIDEKGKIIPPGALLPAAERYNLISKIDRWVINNTFALLADNPVFLKQIDFCSINLSGQSLTTPDVLDFVVTQLDESGIQGDKICFEITETAAISNLNSAINFISTLKKWGCQFALDDFGSGLSSFGYLKNLPVDYLKIDGMFVKNIVDDPIDHAMVKSINEIGQVIGMKTIAEFVENDEIKGMLREIGVNYAQGYGIGKPYLFNELLDRSKNVTDIKNPKGDGSEL